ncbi:MAG: alpha/beta hydrolase-fold protein [Spirochaetota bacterium]
MFEKQTAAAIVFILVTGAAFSAPRTGGGRAVDPNAIAWVHELARASEGVRYETFESASMKHPVGYAIYLPPTYEKGTSARYPVIYWLHGIGGNEAQSSRLSSYLNGYIASGKAEPAIMVFVNGAIWSMYLDSFDGTIMVETSIIKELIPHIDSRYRTVASKIGRALEGFSMGGFGALHLAFKYPDLFASVVVYAPAVCMTNMIAQSHADIFRIMLNSDSERLTAEEPAGLAARNAEAIRLSLRIRIAVGTADIVYQGAKWLHEYLSALSIPHEYEEVPGAKHITGNYYDAVGEKGYRFHDAARK